MSLRSRWKGKEPTQGRIFARDEGPGAAEGIVLPLDLVGDAYHTLTYTIPVRFGESQQFSLQVDTGSSDMWVASTSCTTPSCRQANGRLYDPTGSIATGFDFSIDYLLGSASGPIVWERVSLGGYTLEHQALGAVSNVLDEPLSPNFSGILGLALPLNSLIASSIPPVVGNNPDGAAWASNLFGITPVSQAPGARFLSLALGRPGSDRIPSVLGIGRHPSGLIPDPSKIKYSTLVSERIGTLFWKVRVRGLSVHWKGVTSTIPLGFSNTGATFPSAVLDSGVPVILTTSTIANAIYGAIGVSPASDGNYYVPCSAPLNITVSIEDQPDIHLHPLDMTAEPPGTNQAEFCIGMIQAADAQLTNPLTSIADIVLGVPFMRNVYTVMAYSTPDAQGRFTPPVNRTAAIIPVIGMLPLTDPSVAAQEFTTVRILNQPLPTNPNPNANTGTGSDANTVNVVRKGLSTGVIVAIAVVSAILVFGLIFLFRFLLNRRRRAAEEASRAALDEKTAYMLTQSLRGGLDFGPTEDELRQRRFQAYLREKSLSGQFDPPDTLDSEDRTESMEAEVVRRSASVGDDVEHWAAGVTVRPAANWERHDDTAGVGDTDIPLVVDQSLPGSPEVALFPNFRHPAAEGSPDHRHVASIDAPLLHSRKSSSSVEVVTDYTPAAQQFLSPLPTDPIPQEPSTDSEPQMTGVGTAMRLSRTESDTLRDTIPNAKSDNPAAPR